VGGGRDAAGLEIQAAGTRILTCIEPVDTLARLFPTRELSERVARGVALVEAASTLEVTSAAGTDVRWRLGAYPVYGQHGFADRPGSWDHWSSSGMVYTYGADDGVDGRVVLTPGDVVLPFKRYVQSEVVFEIRAGRIVEIGGGFDADLIREYMAQFEDDDAYGISHIGWGMNEAARWSGLATDQRGHGMELRGFAGNVLFSTGPNTQASGPNTTACHLDIPMRHHSLSLDGEPVVVDGRVVPAELQRAGTPA
jgi:2,5-dihydroxypyridine 5,6-dioxygenase